MPTSRSKVTTGRGGSSRGGTAAAGGVSRDAVRRATGRTWDQWFTVLDRAGARTKSHPRIAELLHERHDLSPWWAQMVTVGYEQERLGRAKHEKPGGFEVSASRTVDVPLSRLYRAWAEKRARRRWLPEADFVLRKATREKSMRITWVDGTTHVDVHFAEKGTAKSRVSVQHKKLADGAQAEATKRLWRARLADLKAVLEGSPRSG